MILCPHSHLGAPRVICLEIKGPSPLSLFVEPFHSFWHMKDFTRPSNHLPSYWIIISALLRGLSFILWSYLVGLSPKYCYFVHEFIIRAINPPSFWIIISALLRGLSFILWSYLMGLSPKDCYFVHYFIIRGIIRQIESLRGSYTMMRGSYAKSFMFIA